MPSIDCPPWLFLSRFVSGRSEPSIRASSQNRETGSELSTIKQYEWAGPRIGGPVSVPIPVTGIWMRLRKGVRSGLATHAFVSSDSRSKRDDDVTAGPADSSLLQHQYGCGECEAGRVWAVLPYGRVAGRDR